MAPPPLLLLLLLLLAVSSCASAAASTGAPVVGEDYVRPPARRHRKALLSLFPWSKKQASSSASDPQQVTSHGCSLYWAYFATEFVPDYSRIDEL